MNALAHRVDADARRHRVAVRAPRGLRAPHALRVLALALAGTAGSMALLAHLASRIG